MHPSEATRIAVFEAHEKVTEAEKFYDRVCGMVEKKERSAERRKKFLRLACAVVCAVGMVGGGFIPFEVLAVEQRDWIVAGFLELMGLSALVVTLSATQSRKLLEEYLVVRTSRNDAARIADGTARLTLTLDDADIRRTLDSLNGRFTEVRNTLPNLDKYR